MSLIASFRKRLLPALGAAALVQAVLLSPAPPPAAAAGSLTWRGCLRAAELSPGGCYNAGQYGIEDPVETVVSPDGISLYVAAEGPYVFPPPGQIQKGDGGIAVYRRDPATGDVFWDGCLRGQYRAPNGCYTTGQFGLHTVTSGLAVSSDGKSLYAASGDVVIYSRETANGHIHWNGCLTDAGAPSPGCWAVVGLRNSRDVAVSSDGRSVYVTSDRGVVIFNRDPATGNLYWNGCLSSFAAGCYAVDGLGQGGRLALSADGTSLYLTSFDQDGGMLVQIRRDPATGNLYWNGCFRDSSLPVGPHADVCYPVVGIANGFRLTVSPDGKSVYVAASALVAFRRDAATGFLYWDGCVRDPSAPLNGCYSTGVHGLEWGASGVAVSADNTSLYVASNGLHSGPSSLTVFDRDPTTGHIYWAGCFRDSGALNGCTKVLGVDTAASVTLSPDDRSVYVASEYFSGLVQFTRTR